ncbi:uncharacterized protein LOC143363434 [Halictus rubicundus]|uniref:uncharacterized protein LOC143363434 n=1 Tax=Halictus rubicundus TaxID=77578 RepID=UPI0040366F5D
MNDASIMKILLVDPNGISSLLQPNDFCVVDRGFRDVVEHMKNRGYNVLMPACKGNRAQLITAEANSSRFVTKIRWIVEAVHGDIAQKYRLLHHKIDNKLLPCLKSLCRIASFLHNEFGKRLDTDPEIDLIIDYMKNQRIKTNASGTSRRKKNKSP